MSVRLAAGLAAGLLLVMWLPNLAFGYFDRMPGLLQNDLIVTFVVGVVLVLGALWGDYRDHSRSYGHPYITTTLRDLR